MGTLTADVRLLPEHCPHKLPTSCRLTSTPLCCACADIRLHSATYRIYIDGVGFVSRGTRWQNYCWFCKVFWDNRVSDTSPRIRASSTRIPDVPDQTTWLEEWYDWHRGYRIETADDGQEKHVRMVGQPLHDVDPGKLPLSLNELRAARFGFSGQSISEWETMRAAEDATHATSGPSLEQTLDELPEEAEREDAQSGVHADETYQNVQEAAIDTHSIHTDQNLNADEEARPSNPPTQDVSDRLAQVRAALERAREGRDRLAAELQRADEEIRLRREFVRRAERSRLQHENFARVFGTREEIDESPIGSLFTRAYDRYRQAEESRQQVAALVERGRDWEWNTLSTTEMPSAANLTGGGEHDSNTNATSVPMSTSSADLDDVDLQSASQQLTALSEREQLLRDQVNVIRQFTNTSISVRERLSRLRELATSITEPGQAPPPSRHPQILDNTDDLDNLLSLDHNLIHEMDRRTTRRHAPESTRAGTGDVGRPFMSETYALHERYGLPQPAINAQAVPAIMTRGTGHPGPQIFPDLFPDLREQQEGLSQPLQVLRTRQRVFQEEQLHQEYHSTFARWEPRLEGLESETMEIIRDNRAGIQRAMRGVMGEAAGVQDAMQSYRRMAARYLNDTPEVRGLDLPSDRPEPKTDEEMLVLLACQICFTQQSDTALLPCGHLAMCRWCAAQAVPPHATDSTLPRRPGLTCPVCRQKVKSRVRIYPATSEAPSAAARPNAETRPNAAPPERATASGFPLIILDE